MADSHRTPPGHISAAFDKYADRFESHLITLGYSLPSAIRSLLSAEPSPVGPILDLGCGTGMVASALEGLPIGPITGIDLSERMLHHARAKGLYAELRQGDIVTELAIHRRMWPIIIAADVLCYFGALNEILTLVCKRIQPGGRFFFSVEEIRPNHDGTAPGNGQWALLRQGRYAHSEGYVNDTIRATNWRVVHREHIIVRHEAGGLVPGQLFVVQRNTCG